MTPGRRGTINKASSLDEHLTSKAPMTSSMSEGNDLGWCKNVSSEKCRLPAATKVPIRSSILAYDGLVPLPTYLPTSVLVRGNSAWETPRFSGTVFVFLGVYTFVCVCVGALSSFVLVPGRTGSAVIHVYPCFCGPGL